MEKDNYCKDLLKDSKRKSKKKEIDLQRFKAIWLLYDEVNKNIFSIQIGLEKTTILKIYRFIVEYDKKHKIETNKDLQDCYDEYYK